MPIQARLIINKFPFWIIYYRIGFKCSDSSVLENRVNGQTNKRTKKTYKNVCVECLILLNHTKTKQSIKTNDWILHFINFYSKIFRIFGWTVVCILFFSFLWNVWRILSISALTSTKFVYMCVYIISFAYLISELVVKMKMRWW